MAMGGLQGSQGYKFWVAEGIATFLPILEYILQVVSPPGHTVTASSLRLSYIILFQSKPTYLTICHTNYETLDDSSC
eukprot:scaffold1796_cov60-Cyclotella_meneghiniana.AAC.1